MFMKNFEHLPDDHSFRHILTVGEFKKRRSFINLPVPKPFTLDHILYGNEPSWDTSREFATLMDEVVYCEVFHLIRNCIKNYNRFFVLCSSKGRVGKRSLISRLPNELFYRVIELFITK